MELYKALCEISGEGNVLKDEPMKMHTTFRIGGPADYFIQPFLIKELPPVHKRALRLHTHRSSA